MLGSDDGIKLGSTYGKVLGTKLGSVYGITLDLDVGMVKCLALMKAPNWDLLMVKFLSLYLEM